MLKRPNASQADSLDAESDLVIVHAMRLRGVPPAEIVERLAATQFDRAYERLLAQGFSPAQAREMATASAGSRNHSYIAKLFRRAKGRLVVAGTAGAEALIYARLQELEVERQTMLSLEAEAWAKYTRESAGEDTSRIERFEPVEVENKLTGETERMLRPKEILKRYQPRTPDSRDLAVVIACCKLRLVIGAEQFRLSCLLAAPPPLPCALPELGARQSQAEKLLYEEVKYLYTVEARVAGRNVDSTRLGLLKTLLAHAPGGNGGEGGEAPAGGGDDVVDVTFRILDIDHDLEA